MRRSICRCVMVLSLGQVLVDCFADDTADQGVNSTSPFAVELNLSSISGRVVDEYERPISGAEVSLHPLHQPFSGEVGRWGAAVARKKTGDSGEFRFAESAVPFSAAAKRIFMVCVTCDGFARAFRESTVEKGQQVVLDVVLEEPAIALIHVCDDAGRPVGDARVRRLFVRGRNGELNVRLDDFERFGMTPVASDEMGRLKLPELPEGTVADAVIEHADLAAAEVKDIRIGDGMIAEAVLKPGVPVLVHIVASEQGDRVSQVAVLLRRMGAGYEHPSVIWFDRLAIQPEGTARITVEAGQYGIFSMYHKDFYIISADGRASGNVELGSGGAESFSFQLHRKVQARGRVIDAETGKPVADMIVDGELRARTARGTSAQPPEDWHYVASAETNENGEYSIMAAAGRVRLTASGIGFIAEGPSVELSLTTVGPATVPDLKVQRLPKVTGIVFDPRGKPLVGAILRLRGDMLGVPPAVTDENGRFELALPWLRNDPVTGKPRYVQPLVAFHPLQPLSAKIDVRLDDIEAISDVTLTLEPRNCRTFLAEVQPDTADGGGKISAERAAEIAAQSLEGTPAPELDGLVWLNAPRESMRLTDFRGKYVLLDFWATWCGPCHADFPTIKLLDKLYKDRGLTVIGIHDNSVAPDAVREHVERQGLSFPIVIDTPDGKILRKYKPHGVRGYPSYLLIGPDGKVLHHDGVTSGPSLDENMLEIVRGYLIDK